MIGNTKKVAIELKPDSAQSIASYAQRDGHIIQAPPYYILPVEVAERLAVNPDLVKKIKVVRLGVRRCWVRITEIVTRIITKAQAAEIAPKIILEGQSVKLGTVKVGAVNRYALMGSREEVEKMLN